MTGVSIQHALLLAALLFTLGLVGLLVRRNLIMMLMSVEIMLNAAGLAFIAAGSRWGQADGQVMFLLIVALAAAEIGVGLGLVMLVHRRFNTVDVDRLSDMRG
ncbi:NADH-quinone oxidoreductase subunit NuoK [Candidatus Methylospira mobilis]|uniref:NADH-quinone oxidoreductase subunit K n=1 Tax=Candidatus Methylospira mobilis TaxID=1808979 RepID=A0A5Q0BDL1_9GAMM|nr:NADH-quinone oxidoreductase subunit NuoK [Candidatus Methylospira mobilis]QFY41935.1 NADH-quinone oxidoreductase subunit NuoK [Candidatus Methylospira mobilis]WNV02924.1 NADH-quinone oxidoreductase subunit NuoK [Candidatus Methylospira mobilis]